jgi:cytochrome P450
MLFESTPFAPGGDHFLGHNHAFRTNRMGVLREMSQSPEPFMRLKLPFPGVRAAVVTTPELVQEILVEKAKSFEKSDMLRFSLRSLAGDGLFTSKYDLWKRQRKLMAPLFTPRALEHYAPDMIACSERTIEGWRDGQELALAHETTRLTMGIAGKTLFDADTFSEADEIGRALTVALEWAGWAVGRPYSVVHVMIRRLADNMAKRTGGKLRELFEHAERTFSGPTLPLGKRNRELAEAIEFLDGYVQKMIDERRRSGGDHHDLMSRLLEVRAVDEGETGVAMSDRQVRDEVLTLFVAGHETTATGLAWTVYYLCKNPDIYADLEREVDALGETRSVADLPKLGLAQRVFQEALRLMPPVYVFGRDSLVPVTIGDVELPPPTNVLISPWALHHSARIWPDPERFDPDRFLPGREATRHRYAYLPFGAGPRVCLGNHFAYMEAQLALAVLLRRWHFELLGEDEPEPSATLRPKHGVRVRLSRRG